jgi:hypothetical protein
MKRNHSKYAWAALLATALLAGCGGGGGGDAAVAPPAPGPAPATTLSVTQMLAFINDLIANGSANADPVDVNATTLAVDDTLEPSAI